MNAEDGGSPVTVFLPGGQKLGQPAPRTATVDKAATGQSFTTVGPAGAEVLAAVQGLPAEAAVRARPPGPR